MERKKHSRGVAKIDSEVRTKKEAKKQAGKRSGNAYLLKFASMMIDCAMWNEYPGPHRWSASRISSFLSIFRFWNRSPLNFIEIWKSPWSLGSYRHHQTRFAHLIFSCLVVGFISSSPNPFRSLNLLLPAENACLVLLTISLAILSVSAGIHAANALKYLRWYCHLHVFGQRPLSSKKYARTGPWEIWLCTLSGKSLLWCIAIKAPLLYDGWSL